MTPTSNNYNLLLKSFYRTNTARIILLILVMCSIGFGLVAQASESDTTLRVSYFSNRSEDVALNSQNLKGDVYIFYSGSDVRQVRFYLDPIYSRLTSNPEMSRENNEPFDLLSDANGRAQALNTRTLADGLHRIGVRVKSTSGKISKHYADFTVANNSISSQTTETTSIISHDSFDYSGNWVRQDDPRDFEGSEHYSNDIGATAAFSFKGTSLELFGGTSYTNGYMDVVLDGQTTTVDLWTSEVEKNRSLFAKTDLTNKVHYVTVTVANNPYDSNALFVSLEYAKVEVNENASTTSSSTTTAVTKPTSTTQPPDQNPSGNTNGGMSKETCTGPGTNVVNWNQLWCDVHALHEGGEFPWPNAGNHTQFYGPLYTYASKPDGTGEKPPSSFLGKFSTNLQSVHTWIELTSGSLTKRNAQVEMKNKSMSLAFHLKSSNTWVTLQNPEQYSGLACQLSTWTYGQHMFHEANQGTGPDGGPTFGWNVTTSSGRAFMDSEPNDDGSPGRLRAHAAEWLQNPVSGSKLADVDGMVAWGTFRVVGPDAALADYRLELGVDTLSPGGSNDIPSIPGRLRLVTPQWQTFTLSTLSDAQLNNASLMNGLKNMTTSNGVPVQTALNYIG